MHKIRVIRQMNAAPDHLNVRLYLAGEEHEVGSDLMPQFLAESMLQSGHAELFSARDKSDLPPSFVDEDRLQEAAQVGKPLHDAAAKAPQASPRLGIEKDAPNVFTEEPHVDAGIGVAVPTTRPPGPTEIKHGAGEQHHAKKPEPPKLHLPGKSGEGESKKQGDK